MNVYVVVFSILALIGFLALKPWLKVLVAFIIMSNCFDLAPQIIYGTLTWDYGSLLLIIAGVQLLFQKKRVAAEGFSAVFYMLVAFTAWLVISLAYSLVVYDYPIGDTLKTSRYWIIGYLSMFVFLRLYMVDPDALTKIIRTLYLITYILLIVVVVQAAINSRWLFGLYQQYSGTTRYLPIFIPVIFMLCWHIMARVLVGKMVKVHEIIYSVLTIAVTALTYTRGFYLAAILTFLLMIALLTLDRQIKISKLSLVGFVAFILVFSMLAVGLGDRVIDRLVSGLNIVYSDRTVNIKEDQDTFTGRLKLMQERFNMVFNYNIIMGYGFLHENNVPYSMRSKLKYGTPDYSPEMVEKYKYGQPYKLSLYSPDISWGNIVLVSGFVGTGIFLVFIVVFVLSYRGNSYVSSPTYHLRLAFYLQTLTLLVLMFNGNTFSYHIQIPAFMLAGYIYLSILKSDRTEIINVI